MTLITRKPTGLPPWPILLLAGAEKSGKAQPLATPIRVPGGWAPMGSLNVGDKVMGANGQPTTITHVYERGTLTTRRVTFSDGSSTTVCDDHLWQTWTPAERNQGRRGAVRHTAEMARLLASGTRVFIPMIAPIDEPASDLPLAPYLLGVLIGDGSLTLAPNSISLTCGDPDVIDRAVAMLPEGGQTTRKSAIYAYIKHGVATEAVAALGLGVKSPVRFIPDAYRAGSLADRIALLQ